MDTNLPHAYSVIIYSTLRPPPNVDFVHGYPGIPPGAADRPQAAVKGAIEVRAGPQGVKAKWVRVELRKVETLPGGGMQNTFYDFVGPSPVTIWTASDEYGVLRSQDFPFQIRIPESVPPSIALESRAGIKYELLASVCTKGKKGFLRRRKSNVVSTQTAIIIDKHELHSTWPVYCQPEVRQITHEGVTLTVERNHTCYGPGDRISVMATLKSDSLHTILLRGFELTLKESTIFRAGPYTSGKKNVPQVRVAVVAETRLPVNFSLYGGMVQKAELTCAVSPNHTTTTLNSARHIDITYVLSVKALLGTGQPLVMDLPVILSNWQRNVSHEAIRRIGPAPGLSLLPTTATSGVNNTSTAPSQVNTRPAMTIERPTTSSRGIPNSTMNTVNGTADMSKADELGYNTNGLKSTITTVTSMDDLNKQTAAVGPTSSGAGASAFTGNRLAANTSSQQTRKPTANASSAPANKWLSAEEEKKALYERAKAKVEETQAGAMAQNNPVSFFLCDFGSLADAIFAASQPATTAPVSAPSAAVKNPGWLSAEEEKTRLFHKAQEAARKAQGLDAYSASPPPQDNRSAVTPPAAGVPQYLSAEEEKAALRRYEEAKRAVQRTQLGGTDDVGSSSSSSAYVPPPVASDLPPSFEASVPVVDARTQLAEKERLRREYEARDAAVHRPSVDNVPAYSEDNSEPQPLTGTIIQSAIAEKEMLRRKFEMQDAQARAAVGSASQPPRQASPVQLKSRPAPAPPSSTARILTAAEEKAMLRARFEAEDSAQSHSTPPITPPPHINGYNHANSYTNGMHAGPSTPSALPTLIPPPAPPPLAPKPPASYIQETQEEDARVSRYVNSGAPIPDLDNYPIPGGSISRNTSARAASGLDMHPFTPFSSGFDGGMNSKNIGLTPSLPQSNKRD
ncbi:hypothetical protein J3R30DRAFT_3290526 [Lentinula aciculospora]|uniref:Arrestin C-terminal-like domain-containing protein n=1 Tax=Lentinula aciculospora TaxID=153920 RepID=A0A9W9AAF2_9AGAR|nr:hypothetical protein J3R30DRAFT_3290526 [Lentinula aciculospora]